MTKATYLDRRFSFDLLDLMEAMSVDDKLAMPEPTETPEEAFRSAFPPGPAPIVATNLDVIAQAVLNEKETENGK
jgi:hypothetical protein